jgi:hypothetical protein
MTGIQRLLGVSAGLMVFACGTASPSSGEWAGDEADSPPAVAESREEESPALLSLEVGPEHTVSFHEVGDLLIVAEGARNGTPSVLQEMKLDGASAQAIYEALRPGSMPPAVLVDAAKRVMAARAVPSSSLEAAGAALIEGGGAPALPGARVSNGVGTLAQAIGKDYFLDTLKGCGPFNAPVDQVCFPEWSNGFFAYKKADTATWTVASQNGSFHAKINASTGGGGTGTFFIDHDKWKRLSARGELCCLFCGCNIHARTLRIDIINAEGDTFHVGGAWYGT